MTRGNRRRLGSGSVLLFAVFGMFGMLVLAPQPPSTVGSWPLGCASAEAKSGGRMGGFRRSAPRRSAPRRARPSSATRGPRRSYNNTPPPVPIPVPIPIGSSRRIGASRTVTSGTGGFSAVGFVFLVVVVLVVAGVVLIMVRSRRSRGAGGPRGRLEVARLQLGVQAQRRDLQDRLEALAASADTSSADGLALMLREAANGLRGIAAFIDFGHFEAERPGSEGDAERRFLDWSSDARAVYDREVITNDAAGVRRTQRDLPTDGLVDEDGDLAVAEFFVVTVIVAHRSAALPTGMHDAQGLDSTLNALASLPASEVLGVEIVWTPAARSDVMSREEMDMTFPLLAPL